MSDDNTRDAAEPSPASAGSQPVAWANEDDDGIYEAGLSESHAHYVLERAANGKYSHRHPRIVPLYRSPTLTDAEREAMSAAACICEDAGRTEIAVVINTALERLG
jgi:hypothetical protein